MSIVVTVGLPGFNWTAPLNDTGGDITLELTLQDTVTTDSVTGTVLVLMDTP